MSPSIVEQAEAEADAVEAELGTEEPAPEPEPEPEPAPEPAPEPPSDLAAEEDFKKLERAAKSYRTAAEKALAAGRLPFEPCPCCQQPNLVLPFNPNDADDQMRKAAVEMYFGAGAPDYKASTDVETCTACDGWGDVLSGSRHPTHLTKACTKCGGMGYQNKETVISQYVLAPPEPYPGSSLTYTPVPMGMPDAWQRPAGHPHWGLDPASVGLNGQ